MSDDVIILNSSPLKDGNVSHIVLSSDDEVLLPRKEQIVVELSTDDDDEEEVIVQSKKTNNILISSLPASSSSPLKQLDHKRKSFIDPLERLFPDISSIDQPKDTSYISEISEIDKLHKYKSIFTDSDDEFLSPVEKKKTKISEIAVSNSEFKSRSITLPEPKKILKKARRSKTIQPRPADETNYKEMLEYYKIQKTKELNNVNKVIRTKEELLQEMVLMIDDEICLTNLETLEPIRIRREFFNKPIIKWKRNVHSIYYKDEDVFIPTETPQVIDEDYLVLYYKLGDLFVNDLLKGLSQLQELRKLHKNHCIILMIEGQDQYLQKLKTQENRNYANLIRQQLNESHRHKHHDILISKDEYEELLIDLQIKFQIHLFPTKNCLDTLNWLKLFTYTISTMRYDKNERLSEFANIGTVRSGQDLKDCFLKSLQHFKYVTPLVSEKIYTEYKNLTELSWKLIRDKRIGKSYVRESVDISMYKFFNSDNANELLID